MQVPTLRNVHIRSAADAHRLFYAVQLGLLPKIEKRLDANERAALRPGDVYVWEEKGPGADAFSVCMERFTEGKSWTASRVREDFLMYFESPKKGKGNARSSENLVVRPGEQDLYIKLTYSVIREDVGKDSDGGGGPSTKDAEDKQQKKPPKWHMNAYFTKLTEGQLRTIEDVPELRGLDVPEGVFRSARTTKPGKRGERTAPSSSGAKRLYAPFPNEPPRRVRPPPAPGPGPVPVRVPVSSASMAVGAVQDAMQQQQQHTGSISLHQPFPVPARGPGPPPAPVPASSSTFFPEQPHRADPLAAMFSDIEHDTKPPLMLTPMPMPMPMSMPMPLDPSMSMSISMSMGYDPLLSQPTPHYAWGADPAYASSSSISAHQQHSPTSSEHSLRSIHLGHAHAHAHVHLSLSPSLSATSTSSASSASSASSNSDSSPMLMSATPPLWENGEPYKPAPPLPLGRDGGAGGEGEDEDEVRVDLAPLETLPRSHMYRRCPADDRALRLLALGPGAR